MVLGGMCFVARATDVFLDLSVTLLTNLLLSELTGGMRLPTIATCLVTNVLVNPFILKSLKARKVNVATARVRKFKVVSSLTLKFVTFTVKGRFHLSRLGGVKGRTAVVNVFRTLFAAIMISTILVNVRFVVPSGLSLPTTVILTSITATATPTTALVMIGRCGTGKPIASMLLPIITLSSTIKLIMFTVSFNITGSVNVNGISVLSIILRPLLRIILSLKLNFVVKLLFAVYRGCFRSHSGQVTISITFIVVAITVSFLGFRVKVMRVAFSSLLTYVVLNDMFYGVYGISRRLVRHMSE